LIDLHIEKIRSITEKGDILEEEEEEEELRIEGGV
jgi:hypothetical protein